MMNSLPATLPSVRDDEEGNHASDWIAQKQDGLHTVLGGDAGHARSEEVVAASGGAKASSGPDVGERVKTGPWPWITLPGEGTVVGVFGKFAWVMFDGGDEPRTWPLGYLEAAE
jgi:hypothetical protein